MARQGTARAAGSAYHHGDLAPALLDAVAEIIREKGIGFVSLREVARRAGVSHGAPAHHFARKAGLLTAFAVQGYQRLAGHVLAQLDRDRPETGIATLESVGRGYVGFAVRDPERFGIMFRLELLDRDDQDFVAASEAAYALLAGTVQRCRQEGSLGGWEPETVAVAAWSLVHGLASLWISGRLSERIGEQDPDRLAAAVSRMFVQTLADSAGAHPAGPD